MINYIRSILGTYTPLNGEGLASLNIEYIVQSIILILVLHLIFKMIFNLFIKS